MNVRQRMDAAQLAMRGIEDRLRAERRREIAPVEAHIDALHQEARQVLLDAVTRRFEEPGFGLDVYSCGSHRRYTLEDWRKALAWDKSTKQPGVCAERSPVQYQIDTMYYDWYIGVEEVYEDPETGEKSFALKITIGEALAELEATDGA